jgi:hypothetical protein
VIAGIWKTAATSYGKATRRQLILTGQAGLRQNRSSSRFDEAEHGANPWRHSFRTLLEELAAVRNTCVTRAAKTRSPAFPMLITASATQQRALQLLQRITV